MDSTTRWLDADEQQAWRSYLRAVRLVDEELRRGLEEHGLSHPEYEILVRLSEAPGRTLRMSELAAAAHTHVAGVREVLVDRLSREQFLALGATMATVANGIDPGGRCTV